MANLESYKEEIIETISREINNSYYLYRFCDAKINNYEEYYAFMDKMTFDEISVFVNGVFKEKVLWAWSDIGPNKCGV